jgi:hypothetical protein
MRRTILYIALALSTFTAGFLMTDGFEGLTVALPVALIILTLIKRIQTFRPTLHHLKVAALTLIIWTLFAAVTLNALAPDGCVVDLSQEAATIVGYKPTPENFKYMGIARVMTIDRGCIALEVYESSEGTPLYTSTDDFDSPQMADEELRHLLRPDVKVIGREPLFDAEGYEVGERVIAARFYGEQSFSLIYRRENRRLIYIGSPSLTRALEFDNRPGFTRDNF